MKIINRLINHIKIKYAQSSPERFYEYLRGSGIKIGKNVHFAPKTTCVDISRPSLVTIGNNCYMNNYFTLLTHDFVSGVFLHKYSDFLPSSGPVTIGNNVRFGVNCTVLKGVTIGSNVFVAAGSLVNKDLPDNCIAGGVPCKVISTLDAFYEKRKQNSLTEAFEYAKRIKERQNRNPIPADFFEEFVFFVDKSNIEKYSELPIKEQLQDAYPQWIENHKAQFESFEAFIHAAFES